MHVILSYSMAYAQNVLHTNTMSLGLQDAIFSGPKDPGPGTRGPGPKLAYIVCTYMYIVHIVHVSLIARLECAMEQTKTFCVQ